MQPTILQLRERETLNEYNIREQIDHRINSFSDLQQMAITTGDCKNRTMKIFSFTNFSE